jgi:hypothetical protein
MKITITAFLISMLILLASFEVGSQESKVCPSIHTGPIAIFIDPTDEELDKMKKDNGEEDFYTIADDNVYFNSQASDYLKEKNVASCHTENEKHAFITKDNKRYELDKACSYWCLIIWNGRDKPIYASPVDIFMYESYLKGSK